MSRSSREVFSVSAAGCCITPKGNLRRFSKTQEFILGLKSFFNITKKAINICFTNMYKQKWLHVSDFLQYDWAVVEKAATTEIIRRDWMREMFHTVYAQQVISRRIISGNLLAVCSVLPHTHTHTQCQRVLGGKWGKMSQWVSRSTLNLGGISCFNWLWRKNLIKWITFFFKRDFLYIISFISNSAFILDYIQ